MSLRSAGTDELIREMADRIGGAGNRNRAGIRWRECEDYPAFEWYYAEMGLYLIRHRKLGYLHFVNAKSPGDAMGKMKTLYEGSGWKKTEKK